MSAIPRRSLFSVIASRRSGSDSPQPHRGDGTGAARLVADMVDYGLASGLALALDVIVLMVCHRLLGLNHLVAAAAGFLAGLALVYVISVRVVFRDRRTVSGRMEIAGFLVTGLAGLALTEALMHGFVDGMGLDVALAKIPTAGLVFLFNFTARRSLLFSRGRGA